MQPLAPAGCSTFYWWYYLDDCINHYNSLVDEFDLTPACETAIISYFDCGAALSCEEISMDPNSCADAI